MRLDEGLPRGVSGSPSLGFLLSRLVDRTRDKTKNRPKLSRRGRAEEESRLARFSGRLLRRGRRELFLPRPKLTRWRPRRATARHAGGLVPAGPGLLRILRRRHAFSETRCLAVSPKPVRERAGVCRRRLNSRETHLTDARLSVKAKDPAGLVGRHRPRDSHNIAVKLSPHVLKVGKDEGAVGIDPARDDVATVFAA